MHPPLPREVVRRVASRYPEPPWRLPFRKPDSHKGDYGRVLFIGGSRGMTGSISLSAICSLRCGSGLVTVAVPDGCLKVAASFNPALMTLPLADSGDGQFDELAGAELNNALDQYDVVAIGPGMGTSGGAHAMVKTFVESDKPAVFDADALNVLAKIPNWNQHRRDNWVLTPHPGEWQRLSGVAASDRDAQIAAAKKIAVTCGAVVLLKGASTFVTDGRREYINPTGNPGMATAGCGDCLTGVIASLLGQGFSCWDSTVLGAWIHGLAGDIAAETWGQAGMTAVEIADSLPAAIDFVVGPLL